MLGLKRAAPKIFQELALPKLLHILCHCAHNEMWQLHCFCFVSGFFFLFELDVLLSRSYPQNNTASIIGLMEEPTQIVLAV